MYNLSEHLSAAVMMQMGNCYFLQFMVKMANLD